MLASSVAVRSLALLMLGLASASALAQPASVSAFNPYNGIGLPGSPAPMAPQASGVYASPPQPGMAFNPWRPGGVAAGWGSAPPTPPAYATYQGSYTESYQGGGYGSGSYLPAPPPGPIESRIVAIPERGTRDNARRPPTSITPAPVPTPAPAVVAPAPSPPPAVTAATPPPQPAAPEPVPVRRTPNTSTASVAPPSSPPAAAVPTPAPVGRAPAPPPAVTAPAPPSTEAAVPPPPPSGPRQPPASGPAMASVNFMRDSAEISGEARTELDRIAKSLSAMKQIEVRAYATGPDPADARKVALARALAVRSYLIDQGVKIRIEVGAFASEARGVGSDRVDVVSPGG